MEKDSNKKKAKTTVKKTSDVKKTTTIKKATKKPSTKKITKKEEIVKEKEPMLNETINVEETKVEKVVPNNEVECAFCHKTFAKGYTICPHCHKRQKDNFGIILFILIGILLLFSILCFHFIEKNINKQTKEKDYQESCTLVDYENLVRHPKDYRNKDVKVIGKVVDVTGYDDGLGNNMEITIDVNQFENSNEQLITVSFHDKDYSQGFLVGDLITVFGKYTSINGNVPNIDAKFIVFGK